MKTTESKTAPESSHASTSALNKNNKDSFFSASEQESGSFFGPGFIQPKLKIGKPNDKYEQEADRVAEQVMRMPEPQVQRQPMREEEKLQKKTAVRTSGSGESLASPQLSHQIKSKSGSGNPLPENVRSEMGYKMGTDFTGVNIHTDAKSHQLNRQLGAKAFTYKKDIYFNEGQYNPGSRSGKRLLAHELTHVVQQSRIKPVISRKPVKNYKDAKDNLSYDIFDWVITDKETAEVLSFLSNIRQELFIVIVSRLEYEGLLDRIFDNVTKELNLRYKETLSKIHDVRKNYEPFYGKIKGFYNILDTGDMLQLLILVSASLPSTDEHDLFTAATTDYQQVGKSIKNINIIFSKYAANYAALQYMNASAGTFERKFWKILYDAVKHK